MFIIFIAYNYNMNMIVRHFKSMVIRYNSTQKLIASLMSFTIIENFQRLFSEKLCFVVSGSWFLSVILKRIRKGKALVLSDDEVNIDTARASIRRLQKQGEFKKLIVTQRKFESGVRRLYVINPSEEKTESNE